MLRYVKESVAKAKYSRMTHDMILESLSDDELETVIGKIDEDETDKQKLEDIIESIPEDDGNEISDNTTSENISDVEIVNLVERLG